MLPNSFTFLAFFAVVAVAYYIVPPRLRWVLLLIASYYFYSTFEVRYVLLLAFATGVAYATASAIASARPRTAAKTILTVGIVVQLATLGLFKYFNFVVGTFETAFNQLGWFSEAVAMPRLDFLLPVGLSFYTFSCISYMVDVYREKIPVERHMGKLAVYVAFFPKLLAGPIERAGPFLSQATEAIRFNPPLVTFGLQLMLWGLFKKVVIADRLAVYVDSAFTNVDFQSPVVLVIGVYLYAFQVYCDFSGYSDMAIGAAAILGITLMENFRRPYLARSVPEFWGRRWHISLMAWFRDYLYFPLGGNRVSHVRWYANLMVVFLVSGLWHGAAWTFIVWGGLNGAYQVVYLMIGGLRERLARLVPSWLWSGFAIVLTFHLILVTWVFFRASSIGEAWSVITRIASALPQLPTMLGTYNWTNELLISIALIVFLMAVEVLDELRPVWDRLAAKPVAVRWGYYYALSACLLVIGYWGMEEFVYMQF